MSGEGGPISNCAAGYAFPADATTGAGDVAPTRSGLLKRIARFLAPHPVALPIVLTLAAGPFSDDQLREIDRRIRKQVIASLRQAQHRRIT